jgi:hypothetical protein
MTVLSGLLIVALAAAAALPAMAEDDDKVMGVYEGAFDGGGWDGKTIRAQVRAESKFAQVAVLKIGDGKQEVRVEVPGRGREGRFTFTGEVDLGALGGKAEVSGKIAAETFTGVIKTKKEAAFTLKRTFSEPPTLGAKAPEGAVALYDGTNLDQHWNLVPHWCPQPDGSVQICNTNLQTKEEFGSGLYHIEFMTPFKPDARGQERGNSGCYILGRYEVQVLDNFGWEPKDNLCGGIYQKAVPIADAVLPPLQWQTYDITFTAAQYDAAGGKTANARITMVHNGVTVHDNVELDSPTPGGVSDQDAAKGPLFFQDHGNTVKFRNIWFKPAG